MSEAAQLLRTHTDWATMARLMDTAHARIRMLERLHTLERHLTADDRATIETCMTIASMDGTGRMDSRQLIELEHDIIHAITEAATFPDA